MEVIRCPKGHFYDAEKSTTCPTCAKESGNLEFSYGDGNVGQTAPTYSGATPTYPGTEPINGGFTPTVPPVSPVSPMMDTQAFVAPSGNKVDTVPGTEPIDNPNGGADEGKKVEDYSGTLPIGFTPAAGQSSGGTAPLNTGDPFLDHIQSFNPVTGWLVCVKGPSKGTDYRVRSQYNYVGRAKHMDICISGDEYISAEKAAIIAYDEMEKKFFIAPGMGHNLIRLNDKMVMGSELLHPYDKITIGKTTLLFVPLCGDQFDWAEC